MTNETRGTARFFRIQTLGCKLNQLESEAVSDAFLKSGFIESGTVNEELGTEDERKEKPAVIVINTCTVTSKADQKARRVIRKALRGFPEARVIVTGCYAQLNKNDIIKLETADKHRLFVVEKDKIIDFIKSMDAGNSALISSRFSTPHSAFQFNPRRFSQHTRSFLKIQDGCDKHCTYCRIRLARGKSVSLDAKEVLSRLRVLEETHAEAVFTGVNICQYRDLSLTGAAVTNGQGAERNLAELLDFLLSGTKKIAVRLSSLAPDSVDEQLVRVLAHPRIRPHFHLSVQSCSDEILEKMGRTYNSQAVQNAVKLLRGAKDDPFIACDIITGFPGETQAEFEKTFNICRKLDFAWIHVFPYSKRPGTPAFLFSGKVHESDVALRVRLLTDLAKQGKKNYVKRWIGREVDVLPEKPEHRLKKTNNTGICCGTSENYLKVIVMCKEEAPAAGTSLRCRIIKESDIEDFNAVAEFV